MFDTLSKKFHNLFSAFAKNKTITENNIDEAIKEVKLALLEADVNYGVALTFIENVKRSAIGKNVIKSLQPKQKFIQIVHEELIALMGKDEAKLDISQKPSVIMLLGLQGSGKTTTAAKLANFLKKRHKKVLVAACDLQRPAAIEQLKILLSKASIDCFYDLNEKKPLNVAKNAHKKAIDEKYDVLIVDTAGRQHVDEVLMDELKELKENLKPNELLFVANATIGQDAVNTAMEFDKKVSITGSILTMLDSDARSGSALSIKEVTKKPLKFEATGENIDDIRIFNPKSMADRILGMGDVINLVRKAEEAISEDENKDLEKKLKKGSFTYSDYIKQMSMIKKMGSIKSLLKMVPGMSMLSDFDIPESELKKVEAIIGSMTEEEKEERVELIHPRRKRISLGSGTSIDDVNKLVKGFKRIKQFLKNMPTKGLGKGPFNMNQFGGNLWR